MILQVIFWLALMYLFFGIVLYILTNPIQGQEQDNLTDLKLYLLAWPVEIYRMYKYSKDEDY